MASPKLFTLPKVQGKKQSLKFATNPLNFLEHNHQIYGDIFETKVGVRHVCIIRSPQAIQQVLLNKDGNYGLSNATLLLNYFLGKGLLTSEGEVWREQRKRLLTHFSRKKIALGFPHYAHNVAQTIADWPQNKPFPLLKYIKNISVRVIIDLIFGTRPSQDAINRIQEGTDAVMKFINLSRNPFYMRENARSIRANMEAKVALIDEAISELTENANTELIKEIKQKGKTSKEIRDEITTLIAAGYESSMHAISSTLYFIEKHPDIKNKMLDELKSNFTGSDSIFRLPYLFSIIQESMRLFPPGWMFFRKNKVDVSLQGYELKKGTDIMINIFGLHRHPALWENATAFKPERFARGQKQPENAYLPFGTGAKFCIGRNLALQEILFSIAHIYNHYDFSIFNLNQLMLQPEITLGLGEPFEAVIRPKVKN